MFNYTDMYTKAQPQKIFFIFSRIESITRFYTKFKNYVYNL